MEFCEELPLRSYQSETQWIPLALHHPNICSEWDAPFFVCTYSVHFSVIFSHPFMPGDGNSWYAPNKRQNSKCSDAFESYSDGLLGEHYINSILLKFIEYSLFTLTGWSQPLASMRSMRTIQSNISYIDNLLRTLSNSNPAESFRAEAKKVCTLVMQSLVLKRQRLIVPLHVRIDLFSLYVSLLHFRFHFASFSPSSFTVILFLRDTEVSNWHHVLEFYSDYFESWTWHLLWM